VVTRDTGELAAPTSLDEARRRFSDWLESRVGDPVAAGLEEYVDAVADILEGIGALGAPEPPPVAAPPMPDEAAAGADGEDHAAASPSPEVARLAALATADFYRRFLDRFTPDLLDTATERRAAIFDTVTALTDEEIPLPESVEVEKASSPLPPPDPVVRPTWRQRIGARIDRSTRRSAPLQALGRLYAAEAAARLEPVLNDVARLQAVALDMIRARLHASPGAPVVDPDPEALRATAERAVADLRRILQEVGDAFGRAAFAPVVNVDAEDVEETETRGRRKAERLLEQWSAFESLAHLEAARHETTADLDGVVEDRVESPLRALADGLRELGERAAREIDEEGIGTLPALQRDAARLFEGSVGGFAASLNGALQTAAGAFDERLGAIVELVPAELAISEERIERVPPRPDTLHLRDAPVERLFRSTCAGTLPRWLERALGDLSQEIEGVERELVRLRNAVDFHVKAPVRGDFSEAHEAEELVVGILHRSAAQVEELESTVRNALDRLMAGLERVVVDEAETVRAAIADRGFLRIRSEIAEEEAVRQLSRGLAWSRRMVDSAVQVGARGWGVTRGVFSSTQQWAQRQLRVGAVEREQMLESLQSSVLDDRPHLQLPPLYRQLFDVEAEVPWEELLVPREAELATLERAFDRWRSGSSASVAIRGEKGSGKTTLVRLAGDRVLAGHPIRTIGLERSITDEAQLLSTLASDFGVKADSWDELSGALLEGEPVVGLVEDAHHLFIRALGGFAVLEAFLEFVTVTQRRVFWVLTIDEYAWNYLDRAIGLAPHFTHEITTTNLPAAKLEEAVMARHEVSGYGLRFETTATGVERRRIDRLLGRRPEGELSLKERRRKAFFRDLNQIAEGNIFLALFYWLRSIDRVDDHDLALKDPAMIDVEFLDQLPLPALHTIAAIILHGGLSAAEHQRIFQLTRAESRLQLASLADSHLVFRSADAGEFKINKVLYRPFIRLLRGKNIF
jgi:hypothetical protein